MQKIIINTDTTKTLSYVDNGVQLPIYYLEDCGSSVDDSPNTLLWIPFVYKGQANQVKKLVDATGQDATILKSKLKVIKRNQVRELKALRNLTPLQVAYEGESQVFLNNHPLYFCLTKIPRNFKRASMTILGITSPFPQHPCC